MAEFVIYGVGVLIFIGVIAVLTHELWSGKDEEDGGDNEQSS